MVFLREFHGAYFTFLINVGEEYGQMPFIDIAEGDFVGKIAEWILYYPLEHWGLIIIYVVKVTNSLKILKNY